MKTVRESTKIVATPAGDAKAPSSIGRTSGFQPGKRSPTLLGAAIEMSLR